VAAGIGHERGVTRAATGAAAPDRRLIAAIRRELRVHADPAKAPAMQAYMKSAMPYYGVNSSEQTAIWRRVFRDHVVRDEAAWQATVLDLWRSARFREERYAAIALTGDRAYRAYQTLETLPLYEELIVTGAWWDYVDVIAGKRIGALLARFPREMKPVVRAWSRSPDLWKRRTTILAQLGFKETTDLRLLYACIEPNFADREFFIRKAIGWALRQYAWTDPQAVQRYVRANRDRLSGLSVREALKNIAS
jgi:3-methyladenine DNA glycosylase AlkD